MKIRLNKIWITVRISIPIIPTIFVASLVSTVALFVIIWQESPHKVKNSENFQEKALANISSSLPMSFIENRGQWDSRVKFAARNGAMTAWFENRAITLQLNEMNDGKKTAAVMRLAFEGTGYSDDPEGRYPQAGKFSFFIGNRRENWQRQTAAYEQIMYRELFQGIDLCVRDNNGILEYDLLMQPGMDLTQVVIKCEGSENLRIDPDGSLLIQTALGAVRQKLPATWYILPSGEKQPVACNYRIIDEQRFGFTIPDLNPALAVVIDPGLEWSTFIGGSAEDRSGPVNSIVVDDNGDILFIGRTASMDFPTTIGAFDTSFNGDFDIYVTRWNPNLSGSDQLIWSTFLGGGGFERSGGIEIDESGNIVVGGRTGSLDFPTTTNAYDTTFNGGIFDGIVTVLDPTGSNLIYSTYFGGSQGDALRDLTLGDPGIITFTGFTSSGDIPLTPTAYDTTFGGVNDVMVAQLDITQSGANQLLWSTYVGSNLQEFPSAVIIDPFGSNVLVAGQTESLDFPTTPGAFRENFSGGIFPSASDGFFVQLDPNQNGGGQLIYSTYVGGSANDECISIMANDAGVFTLAGWTNSGDFPATPGAYDVSHNGGADVYVTRLDLTRTGDAQLLYSTFIGGSHDESLRKMVGAPDSLTLVGWTFSENFPATPNAFSTEFGGFIDAFAIRLIPERFGAAQLEYATYLGKEELDLARAGAISESGAIILGGETTSSDFPTTPNAYDESYNGNIDAFLATLAVEPLLPASKTLFARLRGNQVVPRVCKTPGDGNGIFEFDADSVKVNYEISLENLLGSVTAVRFRVGLPGANGPIVKTIYDGGLIAGDTVLTGEWKMTDSDSLTLELVQILCREGLYVNIATDLFPEGEIRGQMVDKFSEAESAALALPGVLYATLGNGAGDNAGSLIRIDPASGVGTLIGPTGINAGSNSPGVPGLAINSRGEMYATNIGGPANLYRVDAATGEAFLVGNTGLFFPDAIGFDNNDVLFAVSSTSELSRIDEKTGSAALVGFTGGNVRGMACDPTDGTMWGSSGRALNSFIADRLYTIDLPTAAAIEIGRTGFGGATPDIAFDESGNLFGAKGGGNQLSNLISIDKHTGEGTIIGPIGFVAVSGMAMRTPAFFGPRLGVSPMQLKPENAEVGENSSVSVTLTNFGTEDLIISDISDPGFPFMLKDLPGLPLTISPCNDARFEVIFSPAAAGEFNRTITFTSNDPDIPEIERTLSSKGAVLNLAETGKCYAATGREGANNLLSVDRETGAGTLIGQISTDAPVAIASNSSGELFGIIFRYIGGPTFTSGLYRIDPATGTSVLRGYFTFPGFQPSASAFDNNNVLYALDIDFNLRSSVWRVDTENVTASSLGFTGQYLNGMAIDPTDGTLWASAGEDSSDNLFTIDLATGAAIPAGQTGLGRTLTGLCFDQAGNLYGSMGGEDQPNEWVSIDKSTGAGTIIGSMGFSGIFDLTARLDSSATSLHAPGDIHTLLPEVFALDQNYPNPFNPSTTIRYALPKAVQVKVIIYDILGREVRTLVDDFKQAGYQQIVWDGRSNAGAAVASGIYLYRLEAGAFVKTRKLMVLK